MKSDTVIDRLGWKPLSERREEHTKELVNKCLKGHVPDLFKNYFNTRRSDIHSYYTRGSTNLFIDKIRLEVAKRAFYYKGAIIFNRLKFLVF